MHFSRPRSLLRTRLRIFKAIRLQHGGFQKEYFQNPRQMPLPLTGTPTGQHALAPDFPRPRSLVRRSWETLGLGLWSLLFGFGAGSGLVTWAYLQGPFETGTEEENAMLEEITEMMNDSLAMEVLVNNPEWEELPTAPRMVSGDAGKGLNFITGIVTGSRGIVQRIFFHRRLNVLAMIIYFGNGVEGWPDVVHGGIISTILKDAMEKLASKVFPPGTGDLTSITVQFKRKVIPGEVYCLIALPARGVESPTEESFESKYQLQPTQRRNAIVAHLMRADTGLDGLFLDKETYALGSGVFKVWHPFQMDEHGTIT